MTPTALAAAIGGHPIVAEILWRRGVTTVEAARAFLDPAFYRPTPPQELPGMTEAVARLVAAIDSGERIRVWGDFDADGQTATSVLVLGLTALGAVVDYIIPTRANHVRGLNRAGIGLARDEGVRVLLTCDCGVTDFDEIDFATAAGLDVIISDHHDLGPVLPAAYAVINPKRLPPDHPMAHLPGVGVAYKLIEGLTIKLRERTAEGMEEKGASPTGAPFSLSSLLDLVALGIVADVAYQRDETRYLLQLGLAQLRARPRPGVRALLRMVNVDPANVSAESIGYQIGPRLNAVGRLDDARISVELLTTEDETQANELAARIEALNQERKVLQRAVEDEAFRQIARDPGAAHQAVILLVSPAWHPSLLGVVASAVSNRYAKPAILISAQPGEVGRGSARSVRGVDIHAAIAAQGELVETSGGHPMAAGFAIRHENVPAFREGINRYVKANSAAEITEVDQPEAVLAWRDVSLRLCEDLERLAPFGPGNPRPLLKTAGLRPVRVEPLGNDGKHQVVYFQDDAGNRNRAMWWRSSRQEPPDPCDLIYTLQRDVHRGRVRLQLQVVRIDAANRGADGQSVITGSLFQIVDRRHATDRSAELRLVRDQFGADNVQTWYEGHSAAAGGANGLLEGVCTRLQLEPKPVLVILSVPPGADDLALALKRAAPQTVVLLTQSVEPAQDQLDTVLRQLAGMLKVSQERAESPQDAAVVARMAARIGQTEALVKAGIEYLHARQARDEPAMASALQKLNYLLGDIRGYRHYYQAVAAETVLRVSSN